MIPYDPWIILQRNHHLATRSSFLAVKFEFSHEDVEAVGRELRPLEALRDDLGKGWAGLRLLPVEMERKMKIRLGKDELG
jgi:hypothetical protein